MQTSVAVHRALEALEAAKRKWPGIVTDPMHLAAILAEECGEVAAACHDFTYCQRSRDQIAMEAAQVAAVALRILENIELLEPRPDAGYGWRLP